MSSLVKEGVETWTVQEYWNKDWILICQKLEGFDTKALTSDKEAAEYVWRHLSEYLGKQCD